MSKYRIIEETKDGYTWFYIEKKVLFFWKRLPLFTISSLANAEIMLKRIMDKPNSTKIHIPTEIKPDMYTDNEHI